MPPVRTSPSLSSNRTLKVERTHEENQERAYIAASRRSDRSLEARVESARRASEIHKRRTGRSLRVTEQDVINEEMYEEEDDDIPIMYRRLTAHLQTSNAEFDRRLAAYLTNHVAMRTALGQAANPQTQGYTNAAQFANQGNMPQQHPSMANHLGSMGPPQARSPTTVRHSPYPMPNQQRSGSVVSASSNSPSFSNSYMSNLQDVASMDAARRSSAPMTPTTVNPNEQLWNRRNKSIHHLKLENLPSPPQMQMPSPPKSNPSSSKSSTPQPAVQDLTRQNQVAPSNLPNGLDMSSMSSNNGFGGLPFSTQLPPESQQLLGGAFDASDPMTAMLMGSSFDPRQSYLNLDDSKDTLDMSNMYTGGMSQTLAPSFLDTSVNEYQQGGYTNAAYSQMSPGMNSAMGPFSMNGHDDGLDTIKGSRFGAPLHSGEATPSGDWHNFIDGDAWEDKATI